MRILLVEDEPNAALMLAKGLREQTYAVDVAGDGESALYQTSINDYDLIVLDVMLPIKDGFEACRELRAAGSSIPMMLTIQSPLENVTTCLLPLREMPANNRRSKTGATRGRNAPNSMTQGVMYVTRWARPHFIRLSTLPISSKA